MCLKVETPKVNFFEMLQKGLIKLDFFSPSFFAKTKHPFQSTCLVVCQSVRSELQLQGALLLTRCHGLGILYGFIRPQCFQQDKYSVQSWKMLKKRSFFDFLPSFHFQYFETNIMDDDVMWPFFWNLVDKYRISSFSCRGNYSFLNL